jgi:hypothetical protein
MVETSWPVPPDRVVTDVEFERLMSGPLGLSGLVGLPTSPALISADSTGRHVKVRAGRRAFVRGFMWDSGAEDLTKNVAANATGSTRQDLVVLRLDRATFAVTCEVVEGTATLPSPTQSTASSGVYELPVAAVTVPNGAISLAASNVTPLAWYLGQPPALCTASTSPPFTTPGVLKIQSGVLYLATGAAWLQLMDVGRVALGNVWSWRGGATTSNLGDGTRTWLTARNIAVLPSRTYQISALVAVQASLGEGGDQSARLNLYQDAAQGTQVATSGRVRLGFVNNSTTLYAFHPHYRTGSNQTSIPAFNGTLIMYGASGHFNIDGEFSVAVTDVGTVAPS